MSARSPAPQAASVVPQRQEPWQAQFVQDAWDWAQEQLQAEEDLRSEEQGWHEEQWRANYDWTVVKTQARIRRYLVEKRLPAKDDIWDRIRYIWNSSKSNTERAKWLEADRENFLVLDKKGREVPSLEYKRAWNSFSEARGRMVSALKSRHERWTLANNAEKERRKDLLKKQTAFMGTDLHLPAGTPGSAEQRQERAARRSEEAQARAERAAAKRQRAEEIAAAEQAERDQLVARETAPIQQQLTVANERMRMSTAALTRARAQMASFRDLATQAVNIIVEGQPALAQRRLAALATYEADKDRTVHNPADGEFDQDRARHDAAVAIISPVAKKRKVEVTDAIYTAWADMERKRQAPEAPTTRSQAAAVAIENGVALPGR